MDKNYIVEQEKEIIVKELFADIDDKCCVLDFCKNYNTIIN